MMQWTITGLLLAVITPSILLLVNARPVQHPWEGTGDLNNASVPGVPPAIRLESQPMFDLSPSTGSPEGLALFAPLPGSNAPTTPSASSPGHEDNWNQFTDPALFDSAEESSSHYGQSPFTSEDLLFPPLPQAKSLSESSTSAVDVQRPKKARYESHQDQENDGVSEQEARVFPDAPNPPQEAKLDQEKDH